MVNLTFGEQVKIILSRKGMTIKELAEKVELHTGKPMSRQNMTQRLGRDNFQEQDMRLIAQILGCKFQLSIMEMEEEPKEEKKEVPKETDKEMTKPQVDVRKDVSSYFKRPSVSKPETAAEPVLGEINPYTGKEYKNNSVRMHPKRIGYVQVYDKEQHRWTEMTEWAFLGEQERKKLLQGRDYEPPIYLD